MIFHDVIDYLSDILSGLILNMTGWKVSVYGGLYLIGGRGFPLWG
jgi:hypothetical protein